MTEIAKIQYKILQPGEAARFQVFGSHLDIEVTDWITGDWQDYMKVPRLSGYSYHSRHWIEIPQFDLFVENPQQAWKYLDEQTQRGGHYLIVHRANRDYVADNVSVFTVGIAWCKEPFLHPSIQIADSYPIWCPIKM